MIAHLSLIAAVLALANSAAAAPSASASAPSASASAGANIPAPIIPIPDFSGTLVGDYPPQWETAPTNTALVQQWLSELNLTDVPSFPVVPFTSSGDPVSSGSIPADSCDWTVTNCINKDIIVCPVGVWGLTYDDGPTEFSMQLYDFLDTTNQKATLFYIGSNVVATPAAARRACGAGHQIAVHTWSHNPSTSLTNEQFVAEVKYTEMAIKELCGFTPRYFRPPYGDIDDRIRGLLWAMGYTSVIWDYDTNDWMLPPGGGGMTPAKEDAEFATWISDAHNDTTGHITLQHELYQATVDEAIINLPKVQATWKTMPVSACVNDPHPYRETNITLATLNGTVAGVGTGTTTTTNSTSSASASASAPTSTSASASGGKTSGASSALSGDLAAFAMVAAAAVAVSQMLL